MAVAAKVCEPFEDELASDGITEPWLVFEWYFVEAMVRGFGKDLELGRLPGRDKTNTLFTRHDLCWNPSTLEQRTGRIDRIGAKVERAANRSISTSRTCLKTQDEKMYRVVMDRDKWFKVIMGEQIKTDLRTTEKLIERIPLPASAAESLMLDLKV